MQDDKVEIINEEGKKEEKGRIIGEPTEVTTEVMHYEATGEITEEPFDKKPFKERLKDWHRKWYRKWSADRIKSHSLSDILDDIANDISEKLFKKRIFKKSTKTQWVVSIILMISLTIVMAGVFIATDSEYSKKEIPFWEFEEEVLKGNVKHVTYVIGAPYINFSKVEEEEEKEKDTEAAEEAEAAGEHGDKKEKKWWMGKEKEAKSRDNYKTPNTYDEDFLIWLSKNKVPFEISVGVGDVFYRLLGSLVPLVALVGLFIIFKRTMPDIKGSIDNGENVDITFDDIAGYEEIKKSMEYLLEFLTEPEKVKGFGATIPKGVILYGPPGTGKTLLAKALAGTAKVSFFSMSGSNFNEMYAGLGAKRVRELYAEAKKKAPAIVFIDEIDAIGGQRNNSTDVVSREYTQTLNALLAELDGFSGDKDNPKPIITIAATNRLDILDEALVRSGRFDRKIAVPLPIKVDRLAVLKKICENRPFSEEINLEDIAVNTTGFSNADLYALINEACILAITRKSKIVEQVDIDDAYIKLLLNGEKKQLSNKDDLKVVAWHEAGHTLMMKLNGDKVQRVSIVGNTGGAGGFTLRVSEDSDFTTKTQILNEIKSLYAGRVGEELYFGNEDNVTTGASNDIKVATNLIREYLTVFGWSKNGMIDTVAFSKGEGPAYGFGLNSVSDDLTKEAVELSNELYAKVKADLEANKESLKRIAEELYRRENLYDSDVEKLMRSC